MPGIRPLALTVAGLLLGGCVSSILAQKIVAPPNKSGVKPLFGDWAVLEHSPDAFAETWTVDVGPPKAKIAVASIEPGDYGYVYDLKMSYPEGKDPSIDFFHAYWRPAAQVRRVPAQYLWIHKRFKTQPEGVASPYS